MDGSSFEGNSFEGAAPPVVVSFVAAVCVGRSFVGGICRVNGERVGAS